MTNEQIIKEVTSQALHVNVKDVIVHERLMGGMSNYTYTMSVNDVLYTFRIPGKKAEKFVDRMVEKHHIELVESLDLNNETVFLDIESGYKIAKYIEGTPLSDINPLDYLVEAATVLHKIHESGLKSEYDYDPLGRLSLYESHTKEYGYKHCERYELLKARFMSFKGIYMNKERLVLCHGDSQVSNFVKTPDKELKLMDWEFTGNNDPYYDIACFGNSDFNHALELLPVYLKRTPTEAEYNRLYFFRSFQCLQWHNVALYKDFIGLSLDLGVDFKFIANLYLDKAEGFLNNIK